MTEEEKLRTLVKRWREYAKNPESLGESYASTATKSCAAELEYLLDNGELMNHMKDEKPYNYD